MKFNFLNWNELFDQILPKFVKLTKNSEILIRNSGYFTQLKRILKSSEKSVISNYFLVKTLAYLQNATQHRDDRVKWCLKFVRSFPGLGATYSKSYFSKIPKDVIRIVINVKRQLRRLIKRNDWMDAPMKIAALEKLTNLHIQIGYPDDFLTSFDSYYSNFELKNFTTFIEAVRYLNKFRADKSYRLLLQRSFLRAPRYSEVTIPNVSYDLDRNSGCKFIFQKKAVS